MNFKASIAALPGKGAYAKYMRVVAAMPAAARAVDPMSGWHRAELTGAELRHNVRKALMRRINSRAGLEAANEPMPIELVRDAHRLDDIKRIRMRVYQFESKLCRERFAHLLANRDD